MLLFCFKHCKTVIMNRFLVVILCIVSGFCRTCGHPTGMPINTRDRMHPYREPKSKPMAYTEESDEPMHGFIEGDPVRTNWLKQGQVELQKALKEGLKMGTAKNIILFIGDGMGLPTVTMARIFKAQQRNLTGNDALLSWESFPHAAVLRTYTTTTQVADSAATGTALLSGEKTTQGAVGVNQNVARGNCSAVEGNEVHSILKYAIDEGKWTGIISTTKITHATPAAAYASAAERGWESDADLAADGISGCQDIAVQLIEGNHSKKIKVLLSGGRENFYPNDTLDVEYENINGRRLDGRDLVQEWIDEKVNYQRVPNQNVHYVYNKSMFDEVDANTAEYLLGLFQPGYMHFEALRPFDLMKEPSLTEMVDKSIDILSRNTENGYFLLVEGGRIDHAHHENRAYHALMDTLAMQDAVEMAMNKTNIEDTLIVVTADHSHAFSMAGYPDLSNDILGIAEIADDGKPYTTASYANGPGYVKHRVNESGELEPRRNLSHVDTTTIYYQQDAGIYLESETHGGEDVAVYASGPMSHLFHGVHENNYVAHVMMYAACLGENKDHCEKPWYYPGCPPTTSTSNSIFFGWSYFWLCLIVYLCTVVS